MISERDVLWRHSIASAKDRDFNILGCLNGNLGNPDAYAKRISEQVERQAFNIGLDHKFKTNGEFDPGSERTLAAWIRHASRARK